MSDEVVCYPPELQSGDYVPHETVCGHNRPVLVKVWVYHGGVMPGTRWLQYKCGRWWCRWRGNWPSDFGTWLDSPKGHVHP